MAKQGRSPVSVDAHDTDYRVMNVLGQRYAFPVEDLAEVKMGKRRTIATIYEVANDCLRNGYRIKKVRDKTQQRKISRAVLERLSEETLRALNPSPTS